MKLVAIWASCVSETAGALAGALAFMSVSTLESRSELETPAVEASELRV